MKFLYALICMHLYLYSNPSGPVVIHGDVSISSVKNTMQISASDRAIIDWKNFSIDTGEIAQFIQPSTQAVVLNRVVGNEVSHILGELKSNGHLFLINQQGVIIGKDAILDTSALTISTLDMINTDFLEGIWNFKGDAQGAIINYGTIHAWNGDVALLGLQIKNHGKIEALCGDVLLGQGKEIFLRPQSEEKILIRLSNAEAQDGAAITQTGVIRAIEIDLVADGNAYAYAICQKGRIQATGLENKGGKLLLLAKKGVIENTGELIAKNEDETGGKIHIFGKVCALTEQASVDVSGVLGGGEILIGGDYQGNNKSIENAQYTYIGKEATLHAQAEERGDGGKVIVWADESTQFYGYIDGRGGSVTGNGGLAEVSGAQLIYTGLVNLQARNGNPGMLYLDPTDIEVNAIGPTTGSFISGVYDINPAINPNVIKDTDLMAQLGLSSVTIQTASTGTAGLGDFTLNAPITFGNGKSLIVVADHNIFINQNISGAASELMSFSASNNIAIGAVALECNGLTFLAGQEFNANGTMLTVVISSFGQILLIQGDSVIFNGAIITATGRGGIQAITDMKIINSSFTTGSIFLIGGFDGSPDIQISGLTTAFSGILGISNGTLPISGIQPDIFFTIPRNINIDTSVLHNLSLFFSAQSNISINQSQMHTLQGMGVVANNINIDDVLLNNNWVQFQAQNKLSIDSMTSGSLLSTDLQANGSININNSTITNASGQQNNTVWITGIDLFRGPFTITSSLSRPSPETVSIVNSTLTGGDLVIEGSDVSFVNTQFLQHPVVFIRSKNDTVMQNSQIAALGPVGIVVDERFRHPWSIGTGAFIMDRASWITTGTGSLGRLEIWTSMQWLNHIQGYLNGQLLTAGPVFQNSALERWGIFFPFPPLSAQPFAIYYKVSEDIINTILTLSGNSPFVPIVEMLRNLHPYDEYLGLAERFVVYEENEDKRLKLRSRCFIRSPIDYHHVPILQSNESLHSVGQESL